MKCLKCLIYLNLMVVLSVSCKESSFIEEDNVNNSSTATTILPSEDQKDSSGNEKGDENIIGFTIPFEFDNPVSNVVAFDIDEDAYKLISAQTDFLFEILTEDNENHTIQPISTYRNEHFILTMIESNVCRLEVIKQQKPYSPINRKIIFYSLDNQVIEEIYLVIDEDAANMEY